MASKNRTVQNFIALVPDYVRSKSEKYESNLQRCLQVICCMENLSIFDINQPNVVDFFVNIRELLKACQQGQNQSASTLGWKAVEVIKHLQQEPQILNLIRQLEFVPILSLYLTGQQDAEKTILLLSVLEPLTDGIIVERASLWLTGLLKGLTQGVLEKSDYTLPYLLAVLSNFCLENDVVVSELCRDGRSDELGQYLIQFQANDPLVQLYASQVLFCLLSMGSITETLLNNYVMTVVEMLTRGAPAGRLDLIKRCGQVLLWMSRDRLIVELINGPKFQDILRQTLESLMCVVVDPAGWKNSVTINAILLLIARLLRSRLFATKKFTEAFIPALVPLLSSSQLTDSVLELLADLFKSNPPTSLAEDGAEKLFTRVVQLVNQFSNGEEGKPSCRTLRHALQILQKLYKMMPASNGRVTASLKPDTFVRIVSHFVALSELNESDTPKSTNSPTRLNHQVDHGQRLGLEASAVVVEALTLHSQIVSCGGRGGDWLQRYSYLLGQHTVQQCLASAILQGDEYVKQATLGLVGTLGFSTDSVTGLSQALDQLCSMSQGRRGSTQDSSNPIPLMTMQPHWTLSPAHSNSQRIDKLMSKFQQSSQGLHELKRCEVLEVMELQLERRKREELRLRAELDTAGQELSALKISNIQIKAENDRMMSIVLSKSEMVENKDAENRALSRQLEQMQLQLKKAESTWKKECERMSEERKQLERAHSEASAQMSSQLEAAKKQIASLIAKSQEMDSELEDVRKAAQSYKASAEKRERRLEKQGAELKESQAEVESLRKSLGKKEKDVEEKEREINSVKQQLRKSEAVREDVEGRLLESEKTCRETKEQLAKLEKIQEFIFELSSGKKKIFEEK